MNYPAMIHALLIRILERIPTIKDLVRRLRNDLTFQLDCGFLVSDAIPSEASFSRMVTKIQNSNVLETLQMEVLNQAFHEGFITDDTVAIDATHIQARDRAPVKPKRPKPTTKKRGRKPKAEHEVWLKERAERQACAHAF
ncbi:mobile element protein [Geomicrobium sp. JCM 19039]|nr:mobile element protein [Geomicrobium sp. JCM 19039]